MDLEAALDAWRTHRDPRLADLVDTLAARVASPTAPKKHAALHAWWIAHATPYAASHVGALVAHADARLAGREGEPPRSPTKRERAFAARLPAGFADNALARLAAISRWPDDPRAATLLARWLVTAPVRWDPLAAPRATEDFYAMIADRLVELADTRVIASLEACRATPRGPTQAIRMQQRILARQVIEGIAKRATTKPSAAVERRIAAWIAAAGTPAPAAAATHTTDEAALWAEVARRPDDLAPRQVLADVLAERGDPRGELIALQLARTAKAAAKARSLLKHHWATWLGDLALVLNRNGTDFRDGMLHELRVGVARTPEWAFTKVHGHRELGAVRVVRPGHVKPAHYAAFLTSPNLAPHHVALDAPEIVDELARRRSRWTFRSVGYGHQSVRDYYRAEFPPLVATFTALAAIAPDVEEIILDDDRHPEIVTELDPARLRALFPRLARLALTVLNPASPEYDRLRGTVDLVGRFTRDALE